MGIGKRIKNLRKKYNISQVDLALTIDVSKQTMYKYENDIITNIPSDKIELMAEALFTTPSYLMGWTDDPHDWERIGNEEGIHPPKDYNGSYEDYVKFKMYEEQDALIDSYYDSHLDEDINEDYKNTDPDIRRIERARKNMDQKDRDKMMRILEASFEDYFGDDFVDEDDD